MIHKTLKTPLGNFWIEGDGEKIPFEVIDEKSNFLKSPFMDKEFSLDKYYKKEKYKNVFLKMLTP
ncbi:MAG: hypothetical protein LBS41_04425 [Streptococcaceae bacterium]|jgi:hypothetical protein|nr:hypothetical protein [Streptococcaceae bacterium]